MGYQAIRTRDWKLIRYKDLEGMDELYDLIADPYEMENVISNLNSSEVLKILDSQLRDGFRP